MEVKVYDLEKKERDFEYAETKYGVAFRRAKVQPGQKVYRLVELWEKTGHTSLITKVVNEEGSPIANIGVAFYWPDAPSPPEPATEVTEHDWYGNFVHGPTNIHGDVGPGMGGGAYHGPGEGGPHAVWVRDPNGIPSDICEKLGMMAGTFHDHFDQKFKLVTEGDEPEEPMVGRFVEVAEKRRFDRTEGTNHIAINCEEAGERNFYDTRIDLRVGYDWENPDWVDPNPHNPASLYHYNIPADYVPQLGESRRTFWVIIRHAGTEEIMCDPLAFEFETGVHGIHHAYVCWGEDEEPEPPPPPPPPPSWKVLFQEAASLHRGLASVWERVGNLLE